MRLAPIAEPILPEVPCVDARQEIFDGQIMKTQSVDLERDKKRVPWRTGQLNRKR